MVVLPASMYVYCMHAVAKEATRGIGSSGTRVTVGCELPMGVLEDQPVLWTLSHLSNLYYHVLSVVLCSTIHWLLLLLTEYLAVDLGDHRMGTNLQRHLIPEVFLLPLRWYSSRQTLDQAVSFNAGPSICQQWSLEQFTSTVVLYPAHQVEKWIEFDPHSCETEQVKWSYL